MVYMLRKRDIPYKDRNKSEITRLEGTIVLTGTRQNGGLEIITTYRNKNGFKALRCKAKYMIRRGFRRDRRSAA